MAGQSRLRSVLIIAGFAATIALILAMGLFQLPLPLPILPLGQYQQIITVILIVVATKLLLDFIKPVFRIAFAERMAHEADIYALFQLVSYLVWGGVFIGILLVVVGVGVINAFEVAVVLGAIILVMQKPLLNLLGWGVLVTRRLYKLGDRIELSDVRGYVTQITLMKTLVREFGGWMAGDTFTGRYVAIPNSQVLEQNVFNYTRDTEFIWDEISVSVTYESDHKVAERYIRDAAETVVGDLMRNNRGVVRGKYEFADLATYMVEEPTVTWTLGDSSVDMHLVYFCPSYRRRYYRTEIVKRILESFASDSRVAVAYPHVEFVPYKSSDMEVDHETPEDAFLRSLRQ
ncbi:MAG: mechanosensitive ion channel family protein [Thermoplasmata archaeon]